MIFPIANTDKPEVKYGDANGDGEVNTLDALALRKCSADYNYETGTSTVDVMAGADVSGNGAIDASDVLLLRRYMANYDYNTSS